MKLKTYSFLILFMLSSSLAFAQSFKDKPFSQPVSKKYALQSSNADLQMKKLVVDRDDNVFALTDKGLFIIIDDYLVRDRRYRPLADKIPTDITIQDQTGILYYLFEDHYLTNAHAGKPYGKFESGKYSKIAVNQKGEVFLAGNRDYALTSSENANGGRWNEEITSVKANKDDFFVQTESGIYQFNDGNFDPVVEEQNIIAWAFGDGDLYVSTPEGYYSVSIDDGEVKIGLQENIPVLPATSLVYNNGKLWAGSEIGVYSTLNHDDYRYFASKRWLQDDVVHDIAADSEGNLFALTDLGVSEVHFKEMTLAEKAEYFHDRVRKRHLRYGLIGEVRLKEPGDFTTMEMVDTDNDGLWTSFYLGSEVFRYAETKNPEAKRNAMESFEAFERLLSINQLDGFPSRTFEREGYKNSNPDRWRDSPQEGWEWKGHTSTDEYVAYLWVAGIINRHLDLNAEEKERVANFIDSIMIHIIENDYYFVDIDGKPTLWGRWNPEFVNWYPETVTDRKLNSTHLTAGLQLAYALTGKEIYKEEAFRMFEEHGYLDNIKIPMEKIGYTEGVIYEGDHPYPFEFDMGAGGWNHSDDEMYFLTYWVLYHYAFNDDLKKTYADVITDHWEIEKPERNSVWNLIVYDTSGDIDLESVKWHLRNFQLDMVRWDVYNSHRKDLEYLDSNFREQATREVLPPGERETIRYNANPFQLDDGHGGMRSLAGDEFLLPYWMGRYLNVIEPVSE